MKTLLKYPVKLGLAVVAALGLLAVLVANLTTVSAASSCTVADFTTNGVFDKAGYLACLSGAGGLPSTGSNTFQIVGIALGVLAVGIAAVIVTKRRRASLI